MASIPARFVYRGFMKRKPIKSEGKDTFGGFSYGDRLSNNGVFFSPLRANIRKFSTEFPSSNASQSGEKVTEQITTQTLNDQNGTTTLVRTVQFMKEHISHLSGTQKRFIYIYTGGVFVNHMSLSYNDGKEAQQRYRAGELKNFPTEWIAIRKSVQENSFGKFCRSLIWPSEIASTGVSSIVFYFNPAEKSKAITSIAPPPTVPPTVPPNPTRK